MCDHCAETGTVGRSPYTGDHIYCEKCQIGIDRAMAHHAVIMEHYSEMLAEGAVIGELREAIQGGFDDALAEWDRLDSVLVQEKEMT